MMGMELPQFDMIEGSTKGSSYLVIGEKNDLKIGIRPLVFPQQVAPSLAVLYLGFRMRVVTANPEGSVLEAAETFKLPFTEKGGHASLEGGLQLIALPTSVSAAYDAWQNKQATKMLVVQVTKHLKDAGVKMFVTAEQIGEFMDVTYAESFSKGEEVSQSLSEEVQYGSFKHII